MPRFLHTADWQIGRQYSRFDDEDGAILADARFRAVERLAALACTEQVDAVLVAGDVFDAQTVSERTVRRLFQAMAGYAGPWLMIPGNHDAALAESVWTRAARLDAVPANVHVLTTPGVYPMPEQGLAVLAAPLTQRQTHEDLTAWFDTAGTPDGLARVGLAHGSVSGVLADDVDATNPIAADRAATARLAYLALGDWHGCKAIDERTWYSGTPEPERFKDNGAGQALVVGIDAADGPPRVEAHAVGQYEWISRQHELAVVSDVEQLLVSIEQLPTKAVVDLTIGGTLDLAGWQRLQQALGAAAGRLRSLQCHTDGLRLQPTADDVAALQADGYVNDVIDELRSRQQDTTEQADRAGEALAILADLLREQQATGERACN